jgi:hypothetical protein
MADERAIAELRMKKNSRLKVLREKERVNAVRRVAAFKSNLHANEKAMQVKLLLASQAEHDQELVELNNRLKTQITQLGQAQLDALQESAASMHEQQLRSMREAELAEQEQERSREALARARAEAGARGAHMQAVKATRSAILAAERDKARAMGEQQVHRAVVEQEERKLVEALELERQRLQLHSNVDFRFSRVHEGFQAHAVPAASSNAPQPQDPVQAAKEAMARCAQAFFTFLISAGWRQCSFFRGVPNFFSLLTLVCSTSAGSSARRSTRPRGTPRHSRRPRSDTPQRRPRYRPLKPLHEGLVSSRVERRGPRATLARRGLNLHPTPPHFPVVLPLGPARSSLLSLIHAAEGGEPAEEAGG